MYMLIFLAATFIPLYFFCYSSIVFVFKFLFCFFRNIWFVCYEGFCDFRGWIKGEGRFVDYGYYVYGGSFGNGKTLNMVKHMWKLYDYYSKFYKVTVVSNIYLRGIDYLPFQYFEDLLLEPEEGEVLIYVLDEGGSIFYSRNYAKSPLNEDELVLCLNQVRKDDRCILISSQRHKQLDVALRRVCTIWFEVEKRWRFSFITAYDGYDLEYETPDNVQPIRRRVEYAHDYDRKAYKHKEKVVMLERLGDGKTVKGASSGGDVNVNVSIRERGKKKKRKVV